jgi:D-glycero-alpha-D-manno-heptose 1-phosphate guanylyltransferase
MLDATRRHIKTSMQDMPCLLLVGGLGTRLRSVVPLTPKPLASVGNSSFLELLVRQLKRQGICRLLMCTGYLSDQIEREFGNGRAWDIAIEYSKEVSPMGTGGAVKLAEAHLKGASDFLVMNGDSFLEVDLPELIRFHHAREAFATIAVVRVGNAGRYGTVEMGPDGRVAGFTEKSGSELPGLINGGVYVFNRSVLEYFPEGPASLEKDVFPRLLSRGVYALEQKGIFIDIGTPEDYAKAQQICDRLNNAAQSRPRSSL